MTSRPLTIQRVSLVAQVVDRIAREVAAGRWSGGLPAERELCGLLQVSRTTIRSALAELERRGHLRRGAGRRPAPVTRRRTVGIATAAVAVLAPIGFEQLGRFELIWIDALRELLAGHGVTLHFLRRPGVFGPRPQRTLAELVGQQPGATWVLLRSSRVMQEWFESRHVRAVVAGSRHDGVKLPSVEIDVEAVARHSVHHLAARGHRRLAFFIEPSPAAGLQRSEEVFREAGRAVESAEVIHHGTTRAEFLRAFSRCLTAPQAPTGLLVERYTHALTALTWLLGRGVRWPGRVALLSREDTASLDHTTPGVSSYQFDPLLFARKAARLLSTLIAGGSLHGTAHRIQPRLVRRETA